MQKVLTAAALLDAEKVTPLTRITVPETLESSDRVIRDYFPHGTIKLTMTGVLAKSSNVGTVLAARELLAQEALPLPALLRPRQPHRHRGVRRVAGSCSSPWQQWREINHDNIAFGQGLAVNAVQMTAAVNTIANGGEYVQPSLVKGRVTTSYGQEVGSDLSKRRTVVSPEAAAQTRQMMEMVTDPEEGTAPGPMLEGYRVAGKTGTAQRVDPDCGCYGRRLHRLLRRLRARPTTRASPSTSWCTSRRTASAAVRRAVRRSAGS